MTSKTHSPADDLVYDLVSVQYHALKAATLYERFQRDAQGHEDIQEFFRTLQQQDAERAQKCHELLATITRSGGPSGG